MNGRDLSSHFSDDSQTPITIHQKNALNFNWWGHLDTLNAAFSHLRLYSIVE